MTLGISLHKFPSDAEEKKKWIRAIPRADQEPSNNSRCCSLHFKPTDFETERNDYWNPGLKNNIFENSKQLK